MLVYKLTLHFTSISFLVSDCTDGDIKLVNGTTVMEGRVEICYNNTYHTVCDDQWDVLDAMVVCAQLGYNKTGQGDVPHIHT